MTETHPDFLFYSGSTWQLDAALHDAACNPLDLTGTMVAWRLYDARNSKKLELTRDNGIAMINESGGLIRITVSAQQSAPLARGSYRDEIVVAMPSGFVSTQAVGLIMVNQPGSLPVNPGDVQDPCAVLAELQAARLGLLTGRAETRVRIENFEVQYSTANLDALDRAIATYESLCRRQTGRAPRRFAIGSTMRRTS